MFMLFFNNYRSIMIKIISFAFAMIQILNASNNTDNERLTFLRTFLYGEKTLQLPLTKHTCDLIEEYVDSTPDLDMKGCGHRVNKDAFVSRMPRFLNELSERLSSGRDTYGLIKKDDNGFSAIVCPDCIELGEDYGCVPFVVLKALLDKRSDDSDDSGFRKRSSTRLDHLDFYEAFKNVAAQIEHKNIIGNPSNNRY